MITFWQWFFKGNGSRSPGAKAIATNWIALDLFIGVLLHNYLRIDAYVFAGKALFPAASILVSMAIAWSNRATTIIQNAEFAKKFIGQDNPPEDYIYGFQLSMLIMISCVAYVAIMAGGGLNIYIISQELSSRASSIFMFVLLSYSVRECWSVMNFSSLLGLMHFK